MPDKKIFEEYTPVDCNDCSHYWDDSCDGVPEGVERRCMGFKASRRIVIPHKIDALEKAVKGLKTCVLIQSVGLLIVTILLFAIRVMLL